MAKREFVIDIERDIVHFLPRLIHDFVHMV